MARRDRRRGVRAGLPVAVSRARAIDGARAVLLACLAACATGCGRDALPAEQLARMQWLFDEMMIEHDPLCIEAGPFPYRSGEAEVPCDRCQDLEQAGLLTRRIVDDATGGYVEYALSGAGRAVYRAEADPGYLDVVRARFARQGESRRAPDAEALARPRMCFGQTRFNAIADALPPSTFAGNRMVSVKLVAEARDTSAMLFDPRIAGLGLPLPPRPEPGKPALYPARVMTFAVDPDGSLEVSDLRYGKWVNEP